MARYLVTGGAGFIGSNLVRALLDRGDAVTVLDDFSTGHEANLGGLSGSLDVVRGSVVEQADVARAMKGVDAGVLHHAAIASVTRSVEDPVGTDRINAYGTLQVLDGARRCGVRRVTLAASSAAYGDAPELPKREDMLPSPISTYGASKVASELHVRVYARSFGMHAVALRYFNVFGPRQDPKGEYAAAIPRFLMAFLQGGQPNIFGDGEQTRDFCHVADVVQANLLALQTPAASGRVINVARGESVTINTLIHTIAKILDVKAAPNYMDKRAGDIVHSSADISLAKQLLGFAPKVVLEDGLRETVASLRERMAAVKS